MRNISFHERNIIDDLFSSYIIDISNDRKTEECGWQSEDKVLLSTKTKSELLKRQIIEINPNKGIRLIINQATESILRKWYSARCFQIDAILQRKEDIKKINAAHQFIDAITHQISESSDLMNNIIFYGWWAMLESSGMPVAKVSVLLANLSPEEWYIISYRACPHLAFEILENFGNKSSLKESIEKLKGIQFPVRNFEIIADISNENIDQVKTILQWSKIKNQLSVEFIRYIGIIWAIYEGIVTSEMLPKCPESIAQISDYLFTHIEKRYDIDRVTVGKEYEIFIEFCESNSIAWGPEIIRFPEVAQ